MRHSCCLPTRCWLVCVCTTLLVLLPPPVLSLNITGSVANGDAVLYTNSTWVVPLGVGGVILSCDNYKGVWSYQNGSAVPGVGQEAGHAAHQVVTNGSGGVMSRDLVFPSTEGFSEGLQGFYQCTVLGGESAYVGVFLKSGLAPRNLRIVLEPFPTAQLMWDPPEVGVAAVTHYNIVTVHPPGRPVKTVSKHSTWWRFDTRPDQAGEERDHRFDLQVSARYGQFLESTQLETMVLPPPTSFTGSPLLQRGAVWLEWTPITAVISGYEVMFRKADPTPSSNPAPYSTYHSLVRGNATVIISNLAVGGRYEFRVRAKLDRVDIAMLAYHSETVVVETYAEPSAPLMVTVTAVSLSSVTVAWQPPSSVGSLSVLRYYLQVNDEDPLLLPPTADSHTLEDLDPDETYIITVAARNALGVGRPSDPILVIPRQLAETQTALPLEIIIPSVTVGVLLLVICVVTVLFYATVRKRRHQVKRRLTQIGRMTTLTRERGRAKDRGNVPEVEAPPPLPPPPSNSMAHIPTPHPLHQADAAFTPVAVNLRPSTSFQVPRSLAVQVHTDTMTTNATYVGDSQLNFAAAQPGNSRQPPPLPSRGAMLLHRMSSTGSRDETGTDEYEDLNPETLLQANPGYQKLRHLQGYEALRLPAHASTHSTSSAESEVFSGTVDLNTAESTALPIEELHSTQTVPHPQVTGVGVAEEGQTQALPREGAQSVASYEKPVPTKKRKKRRRPPSQPPPPPPSVARPTAAL